MMSRSTTYEDGQALVEFLLIVLLIIVIVLAVVAALSPQIGNQIRSLLPH